jgi:hypothetical protein
MYVKPNMLFLSAGQKNQAGYFSSHELSEQELLHHTHIHMAWRASYIPVVLQEADLQTVYLV